MLNVRYGICEYQLLKSFGQTDMMVVVLTDPFRVMGARRNSVDTKQSSHAPIFQFAVDFTLILLLKNVLNENRNCGFSLKILHKH